MSKPEKTDDEFRKHFWSHVNKLKHGSQCWMWTGSRDGKGYGCIWRREKKHRAHRIGYELSTKRQIPYGKLICHACDVKLCVNPSHLFVGTHHDNMQDLTDKGLNKPIANGTLTKYGKDNWLTKHNKRAKLARKRISKLRKLEWKTGLRIAIRDSKGRIMGTRMVRK